MIRIQLLLGLLLINLCVSAQTATIARNARIITIADMDSLKRVSAQDIDGYLLKRPGFGDTSGRSKDIKK